MSITVRPLSTYPAPETSERRRARFTQPGKQYVQRYDQGRPVHGWKPARSTPVGQTLRELEYELDRIGAESAVLELDITERDCRLDGGIRADARPKTPRVVLSFAHPEAGALRYPCDTFDRWEDNVRALRLALEALRAVDRYGITRKAEQYTGWRALPASTGATLTSDAAARILVANDPETAGWDSKRATGAVAAILKSQPVMHAAARRALAAAHPDAAGESSTERFKLVSAARDVLRAHFGEAATA